MADNKVSARNSPRKTENGSQKEAKNGGGGEIFEVEKIIGKSKLKGNVIYKVRWKGFGPADDTWEPADNLQSCQDMIEEYVQKQSDLAKKRAEDRRAKRALMERQATQVSSKEENSELQYPPTFKNSFWKDLEAGRVNLFDNDMYSKVKKRAVPKASPSTSEPSSPPTHEQNRPKKNRTLSNPEKKKVAPKQDVKSNSTSELESVSSSLKESYEASSSREADIQSRVGVPEVSSGAEVQSSATDQFCMETDSSDTARELMKPALNIVIRKVPSFGESTDGMSSEDSEIVKYSVVQKGSYDVDRKENMASSESSVYSSTYKVCNSGQSGKTDTGDTHLLKREKKKKQHKHRKHKSKHGSRSDHRFNTDTDRKRKVDKTSLSNLEACTSKGTSLKVPKLEPGTSVSNTLDVEPGFSGTDILAVDINHVTELTCLDIKLESDELTELKSEDVFFSESLSEANSEKQVSIILENMRVEQDTISNTSATQDGSSPSSSSCSASSSPTQSMYSASLDSPMVSCSNDLSSLYASEGSHLHTHNLTDTSVIAKSDNLLLPVLGTDILKDVECGLEPVPTIKTDIHRQNSETFDSGIASPASDKSLNMTRQEMLQPLDDLFVQTVLPLLPDNDQTQQRGADNELDIDLDEMDWDLFDKDVKLEAIDALTNSEFARAVVMGDYELVKQSVTGDGKYDLEQPDNTWKTLLMCAVHSMYEDIVELLVDHGANIDAETKTGVTALMIACQNGEMGIVNFLLERGAKVNQQCVTGESALILAAKRGHSQILWLLLECGANFNQMSGTGGTALSNLRALQDTEGIVANHIHRVMSEFDRQVSITVNNTSRLLGPIFPAQVFNVSEAEQFHVKFDYNMHLHNPGLGHMLFVGHAIFTSQEVRCRFYGPCAVQAASLNSHLLSPLTPEGNFVLTFSPLVPGKNVLTLNTVRVPEGKAKLIVCAYNAQLLGGR